MQKVNLSEDMEFLLCRDIKTWKLKSTIGEIEEVFGKVEKNKTEPVIRYTLYVKPKFKQVLKESEYKRIMAFNNIVDIDVSAQEVVEDDNDGLDSMSKNALFKEALKYYKEDQIDRKLPKAKLIELIKEAI